MGAASADGGSPDIRVLGLVMVRNGEPRIKAALNSMALYCDSIYALDERSTDGTTAILLEHATVHNVFRVDPSLSDKPWYIPESVCLQLLYRMVDMYLPDWVVMVNDDERISPEANVRDVLAGLAANVAGLRIPRLSIWNDACYKLMVPLMGSASTMDGRLWRYHPGLRPGNKPLHNGYLPWNLKDHGLILEREDLRLYHTGWSTLAKRIERVRFYSELDPECLYNWGVPYDKGLLFGYSLNEIDRLTGDYGRRLDKLRRGLPHGPFIDAPGEES